MRGATPSSSPSTASRSPPLISRLSVWPKPSTLPPNGASHIETVVADLADFSIEPQSWDGIVSIFAHAAAGTSARPQRGGSRSQAGRSLPLEAYRPEQLVLKTGGPPVAEMMMSLELLHAELPGLKFEFACETVRDVREGELHAGQGAVVQLLARKP